MSRPTNPQGRNPRASTSQPPAPSSQATGRITTSAPTLRSWDTTIPILRFDFPNAQAQQAFHRAFAQVRSEKDKAAFMARYFDNYDGQVSIPRRVIIDTSRDEALARQVQQSLGIAMETERDEEVARRLQQQMGRDRRVEAQSNDEEMASLMQRRLDFERRRGQGYGSMGGVGYRAGMDRTVDRFGGMSVRRRGAYPDRRGPGFAGDKHYDYAIQRNARLPPYQEYEYNPETGAPYPPAYGPGNGGYGNRGCYNGGCGNGYNPGYRNWGRRHGGY